MSTRRAETGEKLGNRGASRGRLSQREVAERIGASPATLRRWVRQGLVPQYDDHAGWSAGGEVLVTRPVVESAGAHLEFDPIGEIKLKGFSVSTEMFVARLTSEEE